MLFWIAVALLVALYLLFPKSKSVNKTNYQNKNVIVTGCSSGIGKSLALEISKCKPNKLVITGRRAEKLEETKQLCKQAGAKDVEIIVGDVAKESDCKELIEKSIQFFGEPVIDHLILNAGVGSLTSFDEIKDLQAYRDIMDTNYWGCVYLTFYALPYMKKQARRGVICIVSSVLGKIGTVFRTGYSPTKHALHGFYDCLRAELVQGKLDQQVQITLTCPGYVLSEIHERGYGNKKIQRAGFMSSEECAVEILSAMDRQEFEYIIPAKIRFLAKLRPFLPVGIVDALRLRETNRLKLSD